MKKILWFDCETTGLDKEMNDPIQISGLIEVDGIIEDEFNIYTQAIHPENIDNKALKVNGLTKEMIESYQTPKKAIAELTKKLGEYCDKFKKTDKFYPAGYNVRFDVDFLAAWFRKLGDRYIGSWWNWRMIDPLPAIFLMDYKGDIDLPDYKLGTVAEYYGIAIDTHNAISDIAATRQICFEIGIF